MITMLNRLNDVRGDESGFTTAELLGNAALGILALVAIWALMRGLAGEILRHIRDLLLNNDAGNTDIPANN